MRISFFAQSQQHIAAVALRLETHERGEIAVTSQPEGIQLELTQDGRATVFPRITLSIRLLPNRQTITLNRNDGVYEIKLPVEPKAVGLDVLKVPVSARELDARKVRRARCMRCRNIVWDVRTLDPPEFDTNISVDDTPPRKIPRQDGLSQERKSYTFRALPSAHWHESSEAWLCHPSGEFTGKLQRWVEKGWWPRWTVALVGERAVGIRVKPGMEEGPGIEPSLTDWHPLLCPTPSCHATLGTRNIRSITAEEEAEDPFDVDESSAAKASGQRRIAETWRLDKYAVQFIDSDEREISCHVDEILSTEMLEYAQSLGVRKFRLADEVTGLGRVSLWLFNTDTDITWGNVEVNSVSHDMAQDVQSGRFATILWQDLDDEQTTASSERHEVLSYPSSAIDTIYATLAGDVDGVPSSLIQMGTWRTGYIRR